MTKTISKIASIKVSKSKSVKSSEKPAPQNPGTTRPDTITPTSRSPWKQQLLDMLARENGASSAEMIALTGRLPHTLRAALSGLRKQGHVIERLKAEDGSSVYRAIGGGK